MAYPVITDIFRAQVAFQGPSGLPEDQFVNNWYFRNDATAGVLPSILAGTMATVLEAFYGQQNGSATSTVAAYLHRNITGATLKVYDLGQTPPRYPIVPEQPLSITFPAVGDALPGEVACCLSFKAGDGPRRKGRIYIGPLSNNAATDVAGPTRPEAAFLTALGESAENVLNTSENVTWMQVSPTDAVASEVAEVWVDDAFDTQRSRGVAPTTRRTWTASGEVV